MLFHVIFTFNLKAQQQCFLLNLMQPFKNIIISYVNMTIRERERSLMGLVASWPVPDKMEETAK